jgi:hypothetical protein
MRCYNNIFYMLLIVLYFSSGGCKNDNRAAGYDSSAKQDSHANDAIYSDRSEIELINVPSDASFIATSYNHGLKKGFEYNIKNYLGPGMMHGSAEIIHIPDLRQNILFVSYFSGGAHCCTSVDALRLNERGVYEFVDSYDFDGDAFDWEYPFLVNKSINYFYTSYSNTSNIECMHSGYVQNLRLINFKFMLVASGNLEEMKKCFINYVTSTIIPDVGNNDDNGERSAIVNFLYDMYSIQGDLATVRDLYFTHTPEYSFKRTLWNEIEKVLQGKKKEAEEFRTKRIG